MVRTPKRHSGRAMGVGGRAYPANRHRVCIRTRSCVRRFPILIAIGGLWVRHADTHAQSNTPRVRGRTVHRSPSIGARTGAPERNTGCAEHRDGSTRGVSVLKSPPRTVVVSNKPTTTTTHVDSSKLGCLVVPALPPTALSVRLRLVWSCVVCVFHETKSRPRASVLYLLSPA